MRYYIGQELRMKPNVHVDRLGHLSLEKDYPCKVVSINRKHRYVRVEFDFPGGKIRESYKIAGAKDLACNVKGESFNKWLM